MRTLALLYTGALLGHSFIATPAKFLAADLTTAQLLLVGRATFGVFAWCELAFIVALLIGARASRRSLLLACIVAVIAGAQHLWLRPILDERVDAILAGADDAPTSRHHVYALLELAKLGLLLVMAAFPSRAAAP